MDGGIFSTSIRSQWKFIHEYAHGENVLGWKRAAQALHRIIRRKGIKVEGGGRIHRKEKNDSVSTSFSKIIDLLPLQFLAFALSSSCTIGTSSS